MSASNRQMSASNRQLNTEDAATSSVSRTVTPSAKYKGRKIKSMFSFVNANRPPTPEEFARAQRVVKKVDDTNEKTALQQRIRNRLSTRAIAFWGARKAKELSEMDRQMVQESRELAAKYKPRTSFPRRRYRRTSSVESGNPLCSPANDDDAVLFLTHEQLPRERRRRSRSKGSFSENPFRSAVRTWKANGYMLDADAVEMDENEMSSDSRPSSRRSRAMSRRSRAASRRLFGSGASIRRAHGSNGPVRGAAPYSRRGFGSGAPSLANQITKVRSTVSRASKRMSRKFKKKQGTTTSTSSGVLGSSTSSSHQSQVSAGDSSGAESSNESSHFDDGESELELQRHISTALQLQTPNPELERIVQHKFTPHTPKSSIVSMPSSSEESDEEEEEESESDSNRVQDENDNKRQPAVVEIEIRRSSSSGLELHSRPSSLDSTESEQPTSWLKLGHADEESEDSDVDSEDEQSSDGSDVSDSGSDDSSGSSSEESDTASEGYMAEQSDALFSDDEEDGLEAIVEEDDNPFGELARISRVSFDATDSQAVHVWNPTDDNATESTREFLGDPAGIAIQSVQHRLPRAPVPLSDSVDSWSSIVSAENRRSRSPQADSREQADSDVSDAYSVAASTASDPSSTSEDETNQNDCPVDAESKEVIRDERDVVEPDMLAMLEDDDNRERDFFVGSSDDENSSFTSTSKRDPEEEFHLSGHRLWSATSSTIASVFGSGSSTGSETSSQVRRNARRRTAKSNKAVERQRTRYSSTGVESLAISPSFGTAVDVDDYYG